MGFLVPSPFWCCTSELPTTSAESQQGHRAQHSPAASGRRGQLRCPGETVWATCCVVRWGCRVLLSHQRQLLATALLRPAREAPPRVCYFAQATEIVLGAGPGGGELPPERELGGREPRAGLRSHTETARAA